MNDELFVFSVPLGPGGTEYSDDALESRKNAVRQEIVTLIPDAKNLMHSLLEERLFISGNQAYLRYYLTESPQLSLGFETKIGRMRRSALSLLAEEAKRLQKSAVDTQIRIGELNTLICRTSSHADEPINDLAILDGNEVALIKLMYAKRGRQLNVHFSDDDITFHFPDIPLFIPESKNRFIRARIESISFNKAILADIEDISPDTLQLACPTLPKRSVLRRSSGPDRGHDWPLLYAATDCRAHIEIEVKVALYSHSNEPAYMELRQFPNRQLLTNLIRSWIPDYSDDLSSSLFLEMQVDANVD